LLFRISVFSEKQARREERKKEEIIGFLLEILRERERKKATRDINYH
jgi:hypothetical protein